MYTQKLISQKEEVVKNFVMKSFRNIFLYFNQYKIPISKASIQKYSSIVISCVSKLVNNNNFYTNSDMNNYLSNSFFYKLSSFDSQNIENNLQEIEKIEKHSYIITFFIWCADSFYYFLKESLNAYYIVKNYSYIIDTVINDKNSDDTVLDLTKSFCKKIYAA